MRIENTSGCMKVIESSSIIIFDRASNIELNIVCDESFAFILTFKFDDEETKKQDLKIETLNNKISLTCINFNNIMGTGTKMPIELAVFLGKKIYINFWVTALGNNSLKRLDYTIYQEN